MVGQEDEKAEKSGKGSTEDRRRRSAAALKENLRRRKRIHAGSGGDGDKNPPVDRTRESRSKG